jgi:hypothetical protein
MTTKNYQEFLQSKHIAASETGFEVQAESVHPMLFDWQREIVVWACRIGKAALFEECGLGKTLQQIEWLRLAVKHLRVTRGSACRGLIVAPLAVAHQTIREGQKIGVEIVYIRHQDEVRDGQEIYITNYDMLKEIDGGQWGAVVLDESSILKNYTGATKRMILEMFDATPYKLACTATPAPNDHLELGNHAQFLGVMQSNEMIQRWFINDTMSAGNYRLKHHAEQDFWRWVTTWAVCISKPEDLGYRDDKFILPDLEIIPQIVKVDHSRAWGSGQLVLTESLSATGMWKEKRATMADRCDRAGEIIDGSEETWIIWCDTNDEADYLRGLFPNAVEVRGSDSIKDKEEKLSAFSDCRAQMIITKAEIAGFGLNWQHCPNQVFVGMTYSFETFYQALRRSWRFGQKVPVKAYVIYAESEGNIRKSLEVKQEQHRAMQRAMNGAMLEQGLGKVRDLRAAQAYITERTMKIPGWVRSNYD